MTPRFRIIAIGAILLGGIGCLAGLTFDPSGLARAWLVAVEALLGVPLGAAAILLIHGLTGGRWGEAIRPQLLALLMLLPVGLVLMVPLLGALPALFPYLSVARDTLPANVVRKLAYLQPFWIIFRTVVAAGAFLVVGWLAAGSVRPPGRAASAVGLLIYAAALTLFATDWGLALEPEFNSTIYPMMVASEQVLGALAVATGWHLLAHGFRAEAGGAPHATLSGDLAKLLITAILGWAYLAYMQWLIVWIGDLPSEVGWYIRRGEPLWHGVFWLGFLAFAGLPFLALLLRAVRRSAGLVMAVAATIASGYVVITVWRLAPAFPPTPALLATLLTVGAIGTLAAVTRLRAGLLAETQDA